MRDIIKTALGIGITMGLADRETFIKQVSEVINQYQDDPEKGDKWAQTLVAYLEQTRNNINLESAIQGAMGGDRMPDKEDIGKLTEAIKDLTDQMKKSNGK